MSTKIFPWRPKYNPAKCRVDQGLPEPPKPPQDERRIMRQLLAEQAAVSLERRAAVLAELHAPFQTPKPIEVLVWGFMPERALAYGMVTNRRMRRRWFSSDTQRALHKACDFLVEYAERKQSRCVFCDFDITPDEPGNVPHGVFVWSSAPNRIAAQGLCRVCSRADGVKAESQIGDQPCILNVKEWMVKPKDWEEPDDGPEAESD